MAKVYGIDLGTTYSSIATLNDNGMPETIENFADSAHTLASAVFFPEGGEPVIGVAAKGQLESDAHRVVQLIKREIGKDSAYEREYDGVVYDAITISSLILKRMAEYAGAQGHDVKDVVITCPAYFGNEERNATRQAGIIAGFNVLNIVNEPTAAAFNYLSREFKEDKKIMVYDLGGGTFDITLFDYSVGDDGKTTIDVIRSGGDDELGGSDWDGRLFDHIASLYADEVGIDRSDIDNDSELKLKLRTVVEATKMSLTGMAKKNFTINHDGDTHRMEVTRDNFERITQDLVDRTMNYVHGLLSEAGVTANEIDMVLLVGGSSKMPMITNAVEQVFPGKWKLEEPDLAVAKGAALAAAIEYNERIREFIRSEEQGGADPFNDGIGSIFPENEQQMTVEEAKSQIIDLPTPIGAGSTIIDRLSRAFGTPARNAHGETVLDNLLYSGDQSPSDAVESYGMPSAYADRPEVSYFKDPIYECSLRRGDAPVMLKDANGNEIDNNAYDPGLLLKEIGTITIEIPPYSPASTQLEYSLRAKGDGIHVVAKNLSTNQVFEAFIESANTKSPDELAAAVKQMASVSTQGDY